MKNENVPECSCNNHGYGWTRKKELGRREEVLVCNNSWCPNVISECPEGHAGPFGLAGIGHPAQAECPCGRIWTPDFTTKEAGN